MTKQDENDAIVTDGHKYACGLKAISGKPIVYSLGSKDQDFELGVLKYRLNVIIALKLNVKILIA